MCARTTYSGVSPIPAGLLGLYRGITGPLLPGQTVLLYDGPFSVDSTVRLIADWGVTNLLAAPTVFSMLRAAGDDVVAPIATQLRVITSGGEPVNPEVVRWAERVAARSTRPGARPKWVSPPATIMVCRIL